MSPVCKILDAKDNLALAKVTVEAGGKTRTFRAKELKENQGIMEIVIESAPRRQKIQVTAKDAAGNTLEHPVTLRVLVTPDLMVLYYMNKPLFFLSLTGTLLLILWCVFLWIRHKRKRR